MIQAIPELDFENTKLKNNGKVDEKERIKVCFECGKTGFFLNVFFRYFSNIIEKVVSEKKEMNKLSETLDSNHGSLSSELENQFQEDVFNIELVTGFEEYYKVLGVKIEDDSDVYNKLIQAVRNSRKKGYHG